MVELALDHDERYGLASHGSDAAPEPMSSATRRSASPCAPSTLAMCAYMDPLLDREIGAYARSTHHEPMSDARGQSGASTDVVAIETCPPAIAPSAAPLVSSSALLEG